ncbi:MAG: terminase large subunit, partial [Gaiellaceae bacterium]
MPDPAVDLLNALILEDGRRWGDAATPWQVADAHAVLDLAGPRFHYLTRPRGASKTTDLSAVAIAALVTQLPARSRSYAAAADRDQAALLLDEIEGFASRADGLSGALRIDAWKVTALHSGATLEMLAADEASWWGLRPHLLIVDEFAGWKTTPGPRRLWRSLFSALPKVPDSRLAILTTAGDPAHPAYALLKRAKATPDRWRVSEVPGPCPWIAEDDLIEQAAELPDWEYRRLHLNEWTESEDRLTSMSDLGACVTLDGPRPWAKERRYAVSLDVGLKNDRTVLAVCSAEGITPSVALDRMVVYQGSRRKPVSLDVVEAAAFEAWQGYGQPPFVADPWQAAQLCQRLRARGVRVEEFTFSSQSVSRLALRLHGLISDHALQLPDDPDLLDELANVRLRETSPGVYRLDHDQGRHDDRAIALALGAEHLLSRPTLAGPWLMEPTGGWRR